MEWKSLRKIEEEKRKLDYRAFDALADMALSGIVTLGEAVEAWKFKGAFDFGDDEWKKQ